MRRGWRWGVVDARGEEMRSCWDDRRKTIAMSNLDTRQIFDQPVSITRQSTNSFDFWPEAKNRNGVDRCKNSGFTLYLWRDEDG